MYVWDVPLHHISRLDSRFYYRSQQFPDYICENKVMVLACIFILTDNWQPEFAGLRSIVGSAITDPAFLNGFEHWYFRVLCYVVGTNTVPFETRFQVGGHLIPFLGVALIVRCGSGSVLWVHLPSPILYFACEGPSNSEFQEAISIRGDSS